jgi:hypothetical protein
VKLSPNQISTDSADAITVFDGKCYVQDKFKIQSNEEHTIWSFTTTMNLF